MKDGWAALIELTVEYLLCFWCFGPVSCVVFFFAVLYCPCHCFHTPDELLCLQMSAPCRLPKGDELGAGNIRYISPLILIDVDPVRLRMPSYGVSYCKLQPQFLISGTFFSLGILHCNNIMWCMDFSGHPWSILSHPSYETPR